MRKGHSSLSDVFYSVLFGGAKGFQLYLSRGGNKNLQCAEGRSILMYSIESGNEELFDLCLSKQVDYNILDAKDNTSLHVAAVSTNLYFLKRLVKCCPDIDVNCQNYKGNTPLMQAVLEGQPQAVFLLLNSNCDPNIKNKDGNTALHLIILNNPEMHLLTDPRIPLLKTFIKHNADWTITNAKYASGCTPLMCAIYNKDITLVDEILSSCPIKYFTQDLYELYNKNNQCYKEILLLKGVNPCIVLDSFLASLSTNDLHCIVQNYAFATSVVRNNPLLECCFGNRTKYLSTYLVTLLQKCGLQLTKASSFVKLPEILLVELNSLVKTFPNEPVSLKAQTRSCIRRHLRFNISEKILFLPLPRSMKKYLLFFDVFDPKYSYNVNKYFRNKMILK